MSWSPVGKTFLSSQLWTSRHLILLKFGSTFHILVTNEPWAPSNFYEEYTDFYSLWKHLQNDLVCNDLQVCNATDTIVNVLNHLIVLYWNWKSFQGLQRCLPWEGDSSCQMLDKSHFQLSLKRTHCWPKLRQSVTLVVPLW